ncbi:hypothetical protein Tco_0682748 [Tanacetum coccineum]|uniref:Uncharacterized protein n=1 Tax=Tanacetum coccineum TaxID=301880 RepID=A0ABQ4XTF6_9ASTR
MPISLRPSILPISMVELSMRTTSLREDHFAKDCFSKTSEPSYKSSMSSQSSMSKGFQPSKLYSSSDLKSSQSKNKGLVAETFDCDDEEVSDDDEVTEVKVLIALADDELSVGKNHARNGEWIDIPIKKIIIIDQSFVEDQRLNLLSKYNQLTFELNKYRDELIALKQAKLDAVTFQIQNTELTKLNHALQEQLKEEKMINEKWLTSSKKVSQCLSEQIPHHQKKILGGSSLTESVTNEINENLFVPASLGYDHETVPKSKDWVERLNPESKLPNFNTERILLPEIQAVNDFCKVPLLKDQMILSLGMMKHIKPVVLESSSNNVLEIKKDEEPKLITPSVPTESIKLEQESKIDEFSKFVQMLINDKFNSDVKAQQTESFKSVDSLKVNSSKTQGASSSKSSRSQRKVTLLPVSPPDRKALSQGSSCALEEGTGSEKKMRIYLSRNNVG